MAAVSPRSAVKAASSSSTAKQRALSRVEFVAALVSVAIRKFVIPQIVSDVSDALEKLFREHIVAQLGDRLPTPDDLRRDHLYIEETDDALEAHLQRALAALAEA